MTVGYWRRSSICTYYFDLLAVNGIQVSWIDIGTFYNSSYKECL